MGLQFHNIPRLFPSTAICWLRFDPRKLQLSDASAMVLSMLSPHETKRHNCLFWICHPQSATDRHTTCFPNAGWEGCAKNREMRSNLKTKVRPNKYEQGRFLVEMPFKFTRTVYRTAICPQESANLLPEKILTGYLSATGCPKNHLCFLASHVSVRSPQNDMFTVTVLQHAVHTIYVYVRIYRQVKPLARLQTRSSRSRSAPATVPVAPIV